MFKHRACTYDRQSRISRVSPPPKTLTGLKGGDILAVLPPKETAPKVDEIILIEKDEKAFIAHRVIGFNRTGTFVRTHGDSRLFRDRLLHPGYGCGLVIAVLRDNRLMGAPPSPRLYQEISGHSRIYVFHYNKTPEG